MSNFLAIDQGTTSSRAIVFNSQLNAITDSQEEYFLSYPNDGWVEADPADILKTVQNTVSDVLKKENAITACGITNQRESTVVWSRETDEPIYPAIIWQDRRTHEFCKKLKDSGHEKMVREKTGLVIDPYFSATKIKWILDNVTGARELANNGKLMFGTIDCYLIYKLTKEKEHYTDVTNASRTMLFNINEMKWDKDLLDLFDIPISMMPSVKSCDANFGTLVVDNTNISIKGVIGDQQAALVGQNCFNYGDMKSTYGTGCFLMVNTKENIITLDEGLLTTVGYQLNNDISYYLHRPSATDKSMAPEGNDCFYVLVPVPNNQSKIDWKTEGENMKNLVIDKMEKDLMPNLRENIVSDFYLTPDYFEKELNTKFGSGFSIQPKFTQSAYFRFHNKSEIYDGLYFVGAGTHPGAGVPGVLSSAKVLDKLL